MKPQLIIGTIAAAIGIGLKLFLFYSDRFDEQKLMFANQVELGLVALVPIFAAAYQTRFEYLPTYEQRLKPLIGASLICGLLLAIFAYCYFSFINPDFGSHFIMKHEAEIRKAAKSPDEFKKNVDFYIHFWQPLNQATSAIFGMFFMGLILSLISAGISGFFIRNNKPTR